IHESGDLGDFQLEKKGLLMLYKSEKEGRHEKQVAKRAQDEGLEAREHTLGELRKLQPDLSPEILGAVHYECEAHTTPNEIIQKLKKYLTDNGVIIKTGEEVVDFNFDQSTITKIITQKSTYTAEEIVLATGSWSQGIARKLNLKIAVQPGKGYRINVYRPTGVLVPAILMEAKVAVTPMKGFTRFAGTMGLSGINNTINKVRVRAIAKAASAYYKGLKITEQEQVEARCGLRPVSPDGLPYIGRTSKWDNLTIATGHAMMGWSLGPATGKLVSEIISGKKLSMNIEGFAPERKL